jgi:hypothetical protein
VQRLTTISWLLLFWSGLTAVVVSTWLLMLFRKAGATRYLPRAYWSCVLFGSGSDASLIFAGLFRMIVMIALFPLIYAIVFQEAGKAEALTGLMAGLVHGAFAGLVLPLAAKRCGAKSPGIMGWNLGRATPLILLIVHGVYGAVLGYIYVNG